MNTIKTDVKIPLIGHRGVCGLERENTCAAFVAAGNRSHYGIETDVHCTLDGKFIIIHDENTARVAGESYIVEETDYDTLRSLRLSDMDGSRREDLCLPDLREYIRICRKYEKKAILEVKKHFEPEKIAEVVEIIREEGWLPETVFISFDFPNMAELRRILPGHKLQYLVEHIDEECLARLEETDLDVDANYKYVTKEQVEKVHALGHEVNVWTVNTAEDAHRMEEYGVDYITSNILEAE